MRPAPQRSLSVDVFRGLTIALMLFVNVSGELAGLPGWLKHYAADVDGFSAADWVFPGFLFAVGLSLPLALSRRRGGGFWTHVFGRAAALIFLGLIMVNMESYDAAATGLPQAVFALLFYAAVYVAWGSPASLQRLRPLAWALLAGLAFLLKHKTADGAVVGLRPEWWGILGIIGWCYLFAALAWRWTGTRLPRIALVLLAMAGLWVWDRLAPLSAWLPLARVFGLAELAGAHAAMVVAGLYCGSLVQEGRKDAARQALWLGLLLLAAGFLARQWYPFSKIQGTLSWSLACSGISALLFGLLRFLVDDSGLRLFGWIIPTGQNALFAYSLPDLLGAALNAADGWGLHLWGWFWWGAAGATGILNGLLWTALILALSSLATRKKYYLKL